MKKKELAHRENLTLLYTNACSVRNKWAEIQVAAESHKAAVVAISETWLTEDDPNPGMVENIFRVHRTDRGNATLGGGVALLIRTERNSVDSDIRVCTPNIQLIAANLRAEGQRMTIACVYRSPCANQTEDQEVIRALDTLAQNPVRLVVVGDFNLRNIDWNVGECTQGGVGEGYLEWMHSRALYQHVRECTRFREGQISSLLDLVITAREEDMHSLEYFPPIGKSDHVLIKMKISAPPPKPRVVMRRNFGKINIGQLRAKAEQLTWHCPTPNTDVEECWQVIKANLLSLQEEFAPLQARSQQGKPPWWHAAVKRAIRRRDRSWQAYKASGSQNAWRKYTQHRNQAVSLIRNSKRKYEIKLAKRVKIEPKRYYSYAQSKCSTRKEMGPLIEGGSSIEDEQGKADAFCNYFRGVHRVDAGTSIVLDPTSFTDTIDEVEIQLDEVLKTLKELDTSKSPGSDGIHPAMVKPIADIIVGPVRNLFELSIQGGKLPKDWKTATVVAIHKGGKTSDLKNYRPVSLTSILCKCLEKIVKTHIAQYLRSNSLLSRKQHGFTKGRSCLTNMLCFLNEATARLDEGKRVEVCYLDFSKAFDSVNHRLLLAKLEQKGITGRLLNWIKDFLTGRSFYVRIGEKSSEIAHAISGVPQGSVLGPLLFSIFIDDLPETLSSPCFIFADDVKIVGAEGREILADDLDRAIKWAKRWDLPLNPGKSYLLTKSEEQLAIPLEDGIFSTQNVGATKDLGVMVTVDFLWAEQCALAAQRSRRALFKLKSVLSCKEPEVFLPIYKTIVRPHMEYCVQAWAPFYKKDANCLEKVQRLATRMVEGQRGRPYEDRLDRLKLFSLERRRLRGDLIETFKIMKGFSGIEVGDLFTQAPESRTRGHEYKLMKMRCRLNTRKHFFSNRVVDSWNSLPKELVGLQTVQAFKTALDKGWTDLFPDVEI